MGDVINLSDHSPHLQGEAICVNCGHVWQAVAPVGTFADLECPSCKMMKGALRFGVVPEEYWECGCGCHLFTVAGDGEIVCWQCGAGQVFD